MHVALVRSRDRFRALPVRRDRSTPLIGIVGEIFCRLHCFSNEDLVRRLEEYEAEAWISDITEWVWYTISEQFRKLHLVGRQYSFEAFKAWVRKKAQKHDEHVLLEPFRDDFVGYEEPPVEEVLEAARPYLPADGARRAGCLVPHPPRAVPMRSRSAGQLQRLLLALVGDHLVRVVRNFNPCAMAFPHQDDLKSPRCQHTREGPFSGVDCELALCVVPVEPDRCIDALLVVVVVVLVLIQREAAVGAGINAQLDGVGRLLR